MILIIFHGSLFQVLSFIGIYHDIIILGFKIIDFFNGNYLDFGTGFDNDSFQFFGQGLV